MPSRGGKTLLYNEFRDTEEADGMRFLKVERAGFVGSNAARGLPELGPRVSRAISRARRAPGRIPIPAE